MERRTTSRETRKDATLQQRQSRVIQRDSRQALKITLQQTTQMEETGMIYTGSADGNGSQHIWQHTAGVRQEKNILFAYDLIIAFSVISKKDLKPTLRYTSSTSSFSTVIATGMHQHMVH